MRGGLQGSEGPTVPKPHCEEKLPKQKLKRRSKCPPDSHLGFQASIYWNRLRIPDQCAAARGGRLGGAGTCPSLFAESRGRNSTRLRRRHRPQQAVQGGARK